VDGELHFPHHAPPFSGFLCMKSGACPFQSAIALLYNQGFGEILQFRKRLFEALSAVAACFRKLD
jgi:hypothetical protein